MADALPTLELFFKILMQHRLARRPASVFGFSSRTRAQRELFDRVRREAEQRNATGYKLLEKAVQRRNTKLYNKLLVDASNHGCLSLVEEASRNMRTTGVPENEWTYGARINAFARSGRLREAQAVLHEADACGIASTNALLAPLVKALLEPRFVPGGGPSAASRIAEAASLVDDRLGVDGAAERPNARVLNTLLRGCKRIAPHTAPAVLRRFESYVGTPHPPVTRMLMAEIACMDLDGSRAAAMVQDIAVDARLLHEVAIAYALRGERAAAGGMLDAAAAAMEADRTSEDADGGGAAAPRRLQRRGTPRSVLTAQQALIGRYVSGKDEPSIVTGGAAHSPSVSWPFANRAAAAASAAHLLDLLHGRRRICVEVGAGAGEWLVAQAKAHPEVAWVGIEPQLDRVHHIWCHLQLHRLHNVHVCASEASGVFAHGLPAASVDAVHVRFPYPPPMELSEIIGPSPPDGALGGDTFLDDVIRVVRPGGALRVLTNDAVYCAWLLVRIHRHPQARRRLRSLHGQDGFERAVPGGVGPSFFESVFEARGLTDWYNLAFEVR